nr:uncharacterized protein LOC112274886 isoform X4 [Physcomitrium patens]|eukprot:XP_024360494.1 uncharacterized protein LOC112274886 isoform X4 [Physcomitrella patens]
MASPMLERSALRSQTHQRDHLRSFIASKQAYLNAKTAQQRAEDVALSSTGTKAALSLKPFPVAEVVQQTQQMEKIHDRVINSIHAALSDESLVQILAPPFNETLAAATKRGASSRWEWQKNTALLELENRNQNLQILLSQAESEALKHQSRAQEDRKILEEALQKGKEETILLSKARDMRARLIEQMQVMARNKSLQATLCAWRHFCGKSRRKRALRRAARMWHARTMLKLFTAFVAGCDRTKHTVGLRLYATHHRSRTLLLLAIRVWWRGAMLRREAKDRLHNFITSWSKYRLRNVVVHWHNHCNQLSLKYSNRKRAVRSLYFSLLRRAWRGLYLHTLMVREKKLNAELFFFLRVARDCLQNWHGLIVRKKQRARQLELGGQLRQSYLVRLAMDVWLGRTHLTAVVSARLKAFIKRRDRRKKSLTLFKWWHLVVKTNRARTLRMMLLTKIERRIKEWAFQVVKKKVLQKTLVEAHTLHRSKHVRRTTMRSWLYEVRSKQVRRVWMQRLLRQIRYRQMQRTFCCWLVYTEICRRYAVEGKVQEAEAKIDLLEMKLAGTAQVKAEMKRLLEGFETERARVLEDATAAIARTPSWTSGFLDAELRWSSLNLEDKWHPHARAGHSAVSMRLDTHRSPCIIIFGGYNGRKSFNDVVILDNGAMSWKTPTINIASGSFCPPPMRNHTACSYGNNRMLLFGGFDGSCEFSDLSLLTFYDEGKICEWSQPENFGVGARPESFSHHTACMTQDQRYMIVFGGYRSCAGHLNETWFLDLHLMTWTSPDYRGIPPSPRRGHGAAIVDKRMYVLGGYNGAEHLEDLHVLNIESMTWELVDFHGDPPSPRRQHAMTAVGRHVVVHGGYDGKAYLDDTYVYDTESHVWKRWLIMDSPKQGSCPADVRMDTTAHGRSMHTMIEAGQRLVIFGGVHECGALHDVLFLENAAAVGGLQLQCSLMEETAKVHSLQANVVGCQEAMLEICSELTLAQSRFQQVHSALKVEAEKRATAVDKQRVLLNKLQKSRNHSKSLTQTCRNRLGKEQKMLQRLIVELEQQQRAPTQPSSAMHQSESM